MQAVSQTKNASAYVMSSESIAAYLQYEAGCGKSKDYIRNCKRFTGSLFRWLPEPKRITKERLLAWRQFLKDHGYSAQTELNYIKGINRYLDFMGLSDIRFNRGKTRGCDKPEDPAVLPNVSEELHSQPSPAAGTRATHSNNTSGHPGIHRKRDKWTSKITFQKVTYQLGSYKDIAEAIAVRQEAERKLREDPQNFSGWMQTRRQSKRQVRHE